MNEVPAATIKKIETLVQIAADLRQGKDFNITRLTILKTLCAEPDAASQFAFHIAKTPPPANDVVLAGVGVCRRRAADLSANYNLELCQRANGLAQAGRQQTHKDNPCRTTACISLSPCTT